MNRLIGRVVALASVVMLVVTACPGPAASPTATPVPPTPTTAPTPTPKPTNTPVPTALPEPVTASGDACVVGVWELTDMGQYMASIMSSAGAEIQFVGQEGYLRYTFAPDGAAAIDANNFVVSFAIAVQDVSLDLAVSIEGAGAATYEAGAGTMLFADPNVGDLSFSASMAGTELFSGTSSELASLFGVSADGTSTAFTYECSGDTFTYTPPVGIPGVMPVVLTRVGP